MRFGMCLTLVVFYGIRVQSTAAEGTWETQPELRQLREIAWSVIDEYEAWSDEYRGSGREPAPADWTVNRMTEELFLRLLIALGESPNGELQRKCLLLLGEKVPREFDGIWRLPLLEMDANLDKSVSREVGVILKNKGLPALQERAMAK